MPRSPRWSRDGAGRRHDDRLRRVFRHHDVDAEPGRLDGRRPRASAVAPTTAPVRGRRTPRWSTRRPATRRADRPRPLTPRTPRTPASSRRSRPSTRTRSSSSSATRTSRSSRRSRSARSAIDDSDYLAAHAADKSLLDKPNGTGPYKLKEWSKGNRIVVRGQPGLLGHQGADAEPRVPLERRGRAALAGAPVRQRRRHRQPGHRRHRQHQGRLEREVLPARGPEHLLPRLQQHREAVGQREDPPGDRHGHQPPADRRQLLPRGLRGRHALHAVRDPVRAARATTPGTSTSTRPSSSSPRAWPKRASPRSTPSSSSATPVRGYLPDPPQIATEIAAAAQGQPRHQRHPRPAGVGRVPRRQRGRHARRHLHARLGRRLPRRHQLPRLPLRVGLGQEVRRRRSPTSSRR